MIADGVVAGADVASATDNPWRSRLYALRGEPLPFFLFDDASLPAASLWSGARLFQKEELAASEERDALVLPGVPSPQWLQRAVAALFSGRPLCVAGVQGSRVDCVRVPLDCVLAIGANGVERAVSFAEVFALADGPVPEPVRLAASDWHEPERLARALASLLQRRHVVCAD